MTVKSKLKNWIINLIGVVAIFVIVTMLIDAKIITRYYRNIIQLVCIYAILAVSLNLVIGILGQLALGHAGFAAVGAYTCALFCINAPKTMPPSLVFIIGLLLAGLMAALFGVLIGIPALRLKGDYLAIITLGFGEIIRVIVNVLSITGGAKGLRGMPNYSATLFNYAYVILVLFVVLILTLIMSRHGRAILSIREDEIASEASGVNTTFYKVFTFALASFMAGVAGGLLAAYNRIVVPTTFDFMMSVEIVVMVVLGGMGSITGAILSAGVLKILPEILRGIDEYRMVIYSLALIIMMLFRPKGLLGRSEFSLPKLIDVLASPFVALYRKLFPKPVDANKEAARTVTMPERPVDAITVNSETQGLLEISHLSISFSGLRALNDVNLTIGDHEIVGLIGPNGAGKTTLFNLLTNVYTPTEGGITLNRSNIVGKKTHQITREGIARTFQNIRLFKEETVIENVKTAFQCRMKYSIAEGMLRLPRFWKEEREIDQRARELLAVFHMEDLANERADSLPYGAQRKLEIARALATNPKLLLLDEPAAGMNPTETKDLMNTIRFIRDQFDISILLIEHDMSLVMGICERILVLDYGQAIALGTPDEIRHNPRVIGAYLGGE